MSSLAAFLNPIKPTEVEFIVSDRFVENGEVVPFKIRPLTSDENFKFVKNNTKVDKRGNQILDRVKLTEDILVSCVTFPELNDAELQKVYGVLGAGKLLKAMLYAGEYGKLSDKIMEISGFDDDINEDVEEAKNE